MSNLTCVAERYSSALDEDKNSLSPLGQSGCEATSEKTEEPGANTMAIPRSSGFTQSPLTLMERLEMRTDLSDSGMSVRAAMAWVVIQWCREI